jgi:hypothetical protein
VKSMLDSPFFDSSVPRAVLMTPAQCCGATSTSRPVEQVATRLLTPQR